MARLLYFLPNKYTKTTRYYRVYNWPAKQLKTYGELKKPLWAEGIDHLFDNDPELCPNFKEAMPEKVWEDCFKCRFINDCNEVALYLDN